MSKKTPEENVQGYVKEAGETILGGKDTGLDIAAGPTDPKNEKTYEASQNMNPQEAQEFEKEVAKEFGGSGDDGE